MTGAAAAPTTAAAANPVASTYYYLPGTPNQSVDFTSPQCFGKAGTFRGGTRVLIVDRDGNNTSDECFGIAPNRAIYHAWRNSSGWDPMPYHGRADDTYAADATTGSTSA